MQRMTGRPARLGFLREPGANLFAGNQLLKSAARRFTACPHIAVDTYARLIGFEGVYAVEPDVDVSDHKIVAIPGGGGAAKLLLSKARKLRSNRISATNARNITPLSLGLFSLKLGDLQHQCLLLRHLRPPPIPAAIDLPGLIDLLPQCGSASGLLSGF